MRKIIYIIVSIMIIIPILFVRLKINEWFYNDVIRIVPEFIWKPLDLILAIGIYSIIALAIYQIIDDLKRNKESEQKEHKSQIDREKE